jgi:hypothetical protein
MSRRADRPLFLGGKGGGAKHQSLFEGDGCDVTTVGTHTTLTLWTGAWTAEHTALARRYKANSVSVHDPAFGEHKTSDFLLDVPALVSVSITIWTPVDLSGLARLAELRSLRIDFGLGGWRLGDRIQPVDFSGLTKLEQADVKMCKPFESILRCRKIKVLKVVNDCDHRLRDLDLSNLPALRELRLDHCPKLRKVILHPKAKVRALEVALCGSYKIDWQRMGADLQYLLLGGRLNFPLEEVLNAPNLEELHIHEIRKLPPLWFLRRMEMLRVVFAFSAPPGPRFSEDDLAVLREFRRR